jgi:uncharacterized protein YecT (DUF1311 family)
MIVLITALLLSAQDPQWNCTDPQTQTQADLNACAAIDFERADAALNAVYRAAIDHAREADRDIAGRMPGDTRPGEEATLREAQRGWIAFRDAQCRLEGYGARGGSMESMLFNLCRAGITATRTAELRGPNPDCPGEPPQAEINQCLEGVFNRADAALNGQWQETLQARAAGAEQLRAAQRAWLTYRDAHCESAVPSVASAEIQTSERLLCRTRMTEARTHELADLAAMAE